MFHTDITRPVELIRLTRLECSWSIILYSYTLKYFRDWKDGGHKFSDNKIVSTSNWARLYKNSQKLFKKGLILLMWFLVIEADPIMCYLVCTNGFVINDMSMWPNLENQPNYHIWYLRIANSSQYWNYCGFLVLYCSQTRLTV